jgi:hypothetical protein
MSRYTRPAVRCSDCTTWLYADDPLIDGRCLCCHEKQDAERTKKMQAFLKPTNQED